MLKFTVTNVLLRTKLMSLSLHVCLCGPQVGVVLLPDSIFPEKLQGRLPHLPPLQPNPARGQEEVL